MLSALPTAAVAEQSKPVVLDQVTTAYPAEALQRGVHGEVVLEVEVSAEGSVTGIKVIEGHSLLVEAATQAARSLRFEPARNAYNVAVPGRTKVTYAFAPHPHSIAESIEVVGQREQPEDDPKAITNLDAESLRRQRGRDLAETLEEVPGVVMSRTLTSVGKPVIRGQPERRLLLIEGGVRHENQKWGIDHAPEIDPSGAGAIRVVKGPAGVLYGPDAMGGVILLDPPLMPLEPGLAGTVDLVVQSNKPSVYAGGRIEGMPAATPGLSFRIEGNYLRGGPQNTPNYVLGNTAGQQWNLRAAVQYRNPTIRAQIRYRHYDLGAGVFYGVQNSTPSAFQSQLERHVPQGIENWREDWSWERPYQLVTHDQITAEFRARLGAAGSIEARYSFQYNHRREFEHTRRSVEGPQYNFRLRTHTIDLNWQQPSGSLGLATGSGQIGLSGLFQENVYAGLALIPNHRSLSGGVFALERLTFPRGILEAGARYDHLSRSAFFARNPYERHLARGTLAAEDCLEGEPRTECPARFHGGALGVGGVLHALPGVVDIKLDLSSASRFPNTDELYLNGSSPTFPVYAIGSPNLGVETAWGLSPTLSLSQPWLHLEVSGHLTRIEDYIYFAPELNENGVPHIDVTIRGAFPRYNFRSIEAIFYGADGHLEIGPDAVFSLALSGSIVRAHNVTTGAHLVGIPPDRLRLAGRFQPKKLGLFEDILLEANVLFVGSNRDRVDPSADLAPSPSAYALVGGALGAALPLRDGRLSVHLEIYNLLNTPYRETVSQMRYYADEPGRDIRIRVGLDF